MGIPKFYRWLSERYPLLNMPVTATEAPPEIDNLYLDMNGIIHNCTHANDPNLKLTETEMVVRIFTYLDKLIHIMKPKKLVFMAIDGVAPRAKMNQQRSRRFKSAVERLALEAEKKAKGEETPDEYKFDSNCITPGTSFMARLGKHLRFFIRKKLSEDPVWQQPVVIFSGHDVPGEGEHKIMEYIRWQKRSPSYAPNQRHCMYGLDADLIMLSLVTHEPHFCLLREVVSFTGKNRGQPSRETLANPSAENFILFQIGLMREYIELEFAAAFGSDKPLPFPLDVERVVDDIVLFCMLVGNDFLPALPTLDIAEGALNQLIDTYKRLLPELGGYLTHAGELNHERLQMLVGAVADKELETLEERAADTEWFESKRSKRGGGRGNGRPSVSATRSHQPAPAAASNQPSPLPSFAALEDLGDLEGADAVAAGLGWQVGAGAAAAAAVVPNLEGLELEPDEPEVGPTMMSKEARNLFLNGGGEEALKAWKERYYKEKLGQPDASPASTREVVQHYIRGLHWVLQYYYRGVASWEWYYPFHYAPMAQDMRRLDNIDVSFNRGKPFKPFEQLLAVLPAASASLLPTPFQWLMTDARSPVLDFYPEKFDIDMEGKRAEWEGVVKVPFIDEHRLLKAMELVPVESLTAEERKRNIPGDMLVFEHAAGCHEADHCDTTLPKHFSSIAHAHSICRHVPVPEPIPSKDRGFVPALSKGTVTGKKNPPGFPTLKTMSNLTVELKMAGVNIFGHPAKKESLVLHLPDVRRTITTDAAAPLLRGMLCGRVYVKWPYLQEAEIVAVSDPKQRISVQGISQHSPEEASKWQMTVGQTKNTFLTKMGIDIGPLPIMLDVRVCTGYKRGADGSIAKEYAKDVAPYPLQAVLQSRPRPPTGFADPDAPKALALTPGTKVVWVGQHYFGCVGTVLVDPAVKVTGKQSQSAGYVVRVQPLHRELLQAESRAPHTVQQYAVEYMPSGAASRMVRLNPRLLGRLTGNVWVEDSSGNRVDIGLAVKNAKQGLCVPSLCRPAEGTGWTYSTALVNLVMQYKARFPNVIAALDSSNNAPPPTDGSLEGGRAGRDGQQKLTMEDLFPRLAPDVQDAKLQEVASWLKSLPSAKHPLVAMTALQASDIAIERLQVQLPPLLPIGTGTVAPVDLEQVHPSLLLPPHDPAAPQSVLAGGAFEPGDRVVVLKGTGAPAFGARGTVIGVLPSVIEVLMDDEYAGGSTLNGRVRGARGAYLPSEQLLNVSKQGPVRAVGPRPRQASSSAAAAATAVRRGSKDAADGAQATPSAAGAAAGVVTSPRAVATRLVELAPWLKGKHMQSLTTAQQQHQALQQQLDREEQQAAAAAAAHQQQQPVQAPAAPTTQGGRLLQMLKQQQQQKSSQHNVTGPGSAASANSAAAAAAAAAAMQPPVSQPAAAVAAAAATAALQQPAPQPVAISAAAASAAASAALQQPATQARPVMQLLGRALQATQQQLPPQSQQHLGQAAPAPVAVASSRAPVEPAASVGQSLLRRLQKGGSGGSSSSDAVQQQEPHKQQQEPVQQQPVRPPPPQQQPALAAAVDPGQQAGPAAAPAAGANLLAMLRKPAAATAAPAALKQPDHPIVRVVPRPQPAAAVASAAAPVQTVRQQEPEQQQQQEPPPKVKVVPRPQKAKVQQQAQTSAEQSAGTAAAGAAAQPPQPLQPQQQSAAVAPALQQQHQQLQPGAPASSTAVQQQQAPVAAAAAVKTRPAKTSDETGDKPKPRTPPAGAGSSLLNRGTQVIQARLPDGTRGFTMGRGARLAANGAASPVPAPGSSNSSSTAAVPNAGVAGAAVSGGATANGLHNVVTAAPALDKEAVTAAPNLADSHLQSGFAKLSVLDRSRAFGGSTGLPGTAPSAAVANTSAASIPAPSPAAAAPSQSGQALMMMLQRGASKGAAPLQAKQQLEQPLPPQAAPLSMTGAQSAAAGSGPDSMAAANTVAACNLLRRLQRQQSAQSNRQ